MREALLEIRGLSKSFPGVKALDGVDFTLKRGTVHALMGENGAGKSTLMKCLFGVYRPDSGEILIEGERVSFPNPKTALQNGVAMVHQELSQALKLTVAENMWLGRFPRYKRHLPFVNKKEMRRKTVEVLSELGLPTSPDSLLEELSVSERQMAEIAKAVSYDARIIVFDEPTSSLTEKEAERLFSIIDTLKKKGTGIIYISHKMSEILRISDEITVLRDGKYIATADKSDMTVEKLIRLMVGRELSAVFPVRKKNIGEPLLKVENLTAECGAPKNASFMLRRGEILGVAGLEGSGRSELLLSLFGMRRLIGGKIRLCGRELVCPSPRAAIKNGFALLTEERRATGIFGILDILENATVAARKKSMSGPFISAKRGRRLTEGYMRRLRIKATSAATRIETLSGGNQQKVIIARWLLTDPSVLLLDEPTRGIDIGAKYEIYSLLADLCAEGMGIIMVSSEMPELLGLSDRIIVMSEGRIAGEVEAASTTQEEIMELCSRFSES